MSKLTGKKAPNIKVPSTDGKTFELKKIKNKYTILYFYPKDDTPGCTIETKDFNSLLSKFKNNVHLIKGNSNKVLKEINMSKIDYVFLDGGHEYNTVLNDLNCCYEVINNNGIVLCDDYDLNQAPGVKKAIDDFVTEKQLKCSIICNGRFAKIQKN